MAEQTLLEMTQNILSALDSDEVNSIGDTTESLQVAKIIQNKYYDIINRGELPGQRMLLQLDPSNDASKPTLMYIPEGVSKLDWVKYFDANPDDGLQQDQFGSYSHGVNVDLVNTTINWATTSTTSNTISLGSKSFIVASSTLNAVAGQRVLIQSDINFMQGTVTSYSGTTMVVSISTIGGSGTFTSWVLTGDVSAYAPGYKYVTMISIEEFLGMINRLNPSQDNVRAYTFREGNSDFTLYYINNKQPKYCTVIENNYILFDSYDSFYDSTLQSSKTLAFGTKVTPFSLTDNFVPDLEDGQFPLLLNESKALAFYELKQVPHSKAEQEIKRQWSTVQKNKAISNKPTYFDQLANFGRVPRTGGFSGGGYGAYKWMRQAGP